MSGSFARLDPLERLEFSQLQAIFYNVSFSMPVTDIQLADKTPRCVLLEEDPAPELDYLWQYRAGGLRREGMRVFQEWELIEPTVDLWLMDSTNQLNKKTRQAGAQITAISTRIAALEYAIAGPDDPADDPEYVPATPAEINELPVRKSQLTKWNAYNRALGKLKTTATWPVNPQWPVMPEPYTNETSATTPDAS